MKSRIPRILALDDDQTWLDQVKLLFEDQCMVETYPSIDQGIQAIETQFYDIILLDLNFDGDARTGFDLFRRIHSTDRGADVIIISAETDFSRLIELFNAGVTQFIRKPAHPNEIRAAVQKTLDHREIRARALNISSTRKNNPLVGGSSLMHKVRSDIARIVAAGSKDILLLGETGTGKEVVAKYIASQCDPSGRFIPLHCAAITDSLSESELFGHVRGAFTGADRDRQSAFEAVGGGFIFLDEIGDMPITQQAKLLRVLQERKVQRVGSYEEKPANFRCIAATHVDFEKAINEKRFRADLFYRLAKEKIVIPPLRERIEDLPELAYYFLGVLAPGKSISITNEAIALLQTYTWPGNVRELGAVVETLYSRSSDRVIRERDVCQALPQIARTYSSRMKRSLVGRYAVSRVIGERQRFEQAIIESNGDRTKAAVLLGMSRATFFRKAKDLGLVQSRRQSVTEASLDQ